MEEDSIIDDAGDPKPILGVWWLFFLVPSGWKLVQVFFGSVCQNKGIFWLFEHIFHIHPLILLY